MKSFRMDNELQQMFRVRPIQDKVIACRSNLDMCRKILKEKTKAELRNLINVEVDVIETELKMPTPDDMPPRSQQTIADVSKVNEILSNYADIQQAFALL